VSLSTFAVVGHGLHLDDLVFPVQHLAHALPQVLVGAQVVEALADKLWRVRFEIEGRPFA